MRIRRGAVATIALGLLVALIGCTPSGPAAQPPTTGDSAPPEAPPKVERPKNLDMAKADPCELVDGLPRKTFGLDDRKGLADDDSAVFPGNPSCFTLGFRTNLGLSVVTVSTEGVTSYIESVNVYPTPVTVKGYPAYVLAPERQPENCYGVVDVNDGQLLYLSYGLNIPDEEPITPQQKLCEQVPQLAEELLAGLGA
ncbi:DUF3558 domain-containing protein [Microlunatus sp. GCM10028923]|uniref:DUF3558 domain-containing protein n=1 Tax=Microlunatus sp. GCM10028923 TaxID=3273400 RepID=UPI0036203AEE